MKRSFPQTLTSVFATEGQRVGKVFVHPFHPLLLLVTLLFLTFLSCQKEETAALPISYDISDYFPLEVNNQWTYNVEVISPDGEVVFTGTQRWEVVEGPRLHMYDVTPEGNFDVGYKALSQMGDYEIHDEMGIFASTRYIDLPIDSLVFITSDSIDCLRERWIRGGLVTQTTYFGERASLLTKTVSYFPYHWEEEKYYFYQDVGPYRVEKKFIEQYPNTSPRVGLTERKVLIDYQLY